MYIKRCQREGTCKKNLHNGNTDGRGVYDECFDRCPRCAYCRVNARQRDKNKNIYSFSSASQTVILLALALMSYSRAKNTLLRPKAKHMRKGDTGICSRRKSDVQDDHAYQTPEHACATDHKIRQYRLRVPEACAGKSALGRGRKITRWRRCNFADPHMRKKKSSRVRIPAKLANWW